MIDGSTLAVRGPSAGGVARGLSNTGPRQVWSGWARKKPRDPMTGDELDAGARMLRTPRAAGVAGVAFSLLLGLALVLLRLSIPSIQTEAGDWLTNPDRRRALSVALALVPFAGIAFLWFMGVVRDRIGQREDRFVATVFLGSGLLFVAMLFTGAAVYGALVAGVSATKGLVRSAVWDAEHRISAQILTVYALRMAAVFVASTTTIAFRTGMLPRWLGVLGYVVALGLLLNSGSIPFVNLVFPLWTLVLSIHILLVAPDGQDSVSSPAT